LIRYTVRVGTESSVVHFSFLPFYHCSWAYITDVGSWSSTRHGIHVALIEVGGLSFVICAWFLHITSPDDGGEEGPCEFQSAFSSERFSVLFIGALNHIGLVSILLVYSMWEFLSVRRCVSFGSLVGGSGGRIDVACLVYSQDDIALSDRMYDRESSLVYVTKIFYCMSHSARADVTFRFSLFAPATPFLPTHVQFGSSRVRRP